MRKNKGTEYEYEKSWIWIRFLYTSFLIISKLMWLRLAANIHIQPEVSNKKIQIEEKINVPLLAKWYIWLLTLDKLVVVGLQRSSLLGHSD